MVTHHITRGYGHPWSRKGAWDLLEAKAESQQEIEAFARKAKLKFWHPWIIDNMGNFTAVLYKPSGAMEEWCDDP